MCFWIFKKKEDTPTDCLVSLDEAITESEYAASIHVTYMDLVVSDPEHYPPSIYGVYAWHKHWYEVHSSAACYMKKLKRRRLTG